MKRKSHKEESDTSELDGPPKLQKNSKLNLINNIYLWGSNADGQLGKSSFENEADSQQGEASDVSAAMQNEKIQIQENEILDPFEVTPIPIEVQKNIQIIDLSLGSRHSMCLSSHGNVFTWGWGACGQLGHGDAVSRTNPVMISSLQSINVCKISAGGIHSGCISVQNEVFTWGQASYGQLGLGKDVMKDHLCASPKMIKENGRPFLAQQLSCGGMHSAAVYNGKVYCWGRGDSGQLGIGDAWLQSQDGSSYLDFGNFETELQVPSPALVSGVQDVRQVATGAFHTAVITNDGELYTWGKEDYGMLGIPSSELLRDGVWRPHHVPKPFTSNGSFFTHVACGGWHTVALCNHGGVWVCGRGEYGRLGIDSETSAKKLTLVESFGEKVEQVSCGGTHTLFLTESGQVYSCGRGDYGRLGLGNAETKGTPTLIALFQRDSSRVFKLSCGGSHSAALSAAEKAN